MKSKFFFLFILFLVIGFTTYAQSVSSDVKKETPATQTTTVDQSKSGACVDHQNVSTKADCKWVDANKDGLCDVCGSKDCKGKNAAPAPATKKCPSSCPGAKSSGCSPTKDGKK